MNNSKVKFIPLRDSIKLSYVRVLERFHTSQAVWLRLELPGATLSQYRHYDVGKILFKRIGLYILNLKKQKTVWFVL